VEGFGETIERRKFKSSVDGGAVPSACSPCSPLFRRAARAGLPLSWWLGTVFDHTELVPPRLEMKVDETSVGVLNLPVRKI
jgi:hypothetical protein